MLLFNFVGFAPSWFLKPWVESPPLAMRTHIHGAIFSGWFIVLMIQVSLVAQRKLVWHRRLGLTSVALAVAMVVSALLLLYHRTLLYHTGERGLDGTMIVVWGNLTLLTGFVAFVTLGYLFRKRPATHKRLMVLASIAMMPQALGRLGYLPSLRVFEGAANNAFYALGGVLVLLTALAIHDRYAEGRIHKVTLLGGLALLLLIPLGSAVMPMTAFGPALIQLPLFG